MSDEITAGQVFDAIVDSAREATLEAVKESIASRPPTIYGASIADRPPADSVPVGAQFIVVNEDLDAWMSNGEDWVVI